MKLTGNRCRCSECGEYFNSVSAFDRHRCGKATERYCEDPENLGMSKNEAGFWITGAMKTVPAFLGRKSDGSS